MHDAAGLGAARRRHSPRRGQRKFLLAAADRLAGHGAIGRRDLQQSAVALRHRRRDWPDGKRRRRRARGHGRLVRLSRRDGRVREGARESKPLRSWVSLRSRPASLAASSSAWSRRTRSTDSTRSSCRRISASSRANAPCRSSPRSQSSSSARCSASSGRPIGNGIKAFSNWAAHGQPALAFTIYGVVERALIPFGLHHVWNVPFFFQAGDFLDPTTGQGSSRRDHALHRRRSDGGQHDRRLPFQNVGTARCRDRDVALRASGEPRQGRRHHDLGRAHLVHHRHHRADRVRISLSRAGALRRARAARRARPISLCIALGIKHGFTFSHGLIDYVVLFPKSHHALWLFVIGPIWGLLYYGIFTLRDPQI